LANWNRENCATLDQILTNSATLHLIPKCVCHTAWNVGWYSLQRPFGYRVFYTDADFIRAGQDAANKRIKVAWSGEGARWYPIAASPLAPARDQSRTGEVRHRAYSFPSPLSVIRESEDPRSAFHDFSRS
jgi:hypothetical protein